MNFHLRLANKTFPLHMGMNILGRQNGCDIQIKDPFISRRHLSIDVLSDGSFTIMDLGSSNGMMVNGHKAPHAILHPGDFFSIGNKTFFLEKAS